LVAIAVIAEPMLPIPMTLTVVMMFLSHVPQVVATTFKRDNSVAATTIPTPLGSRHGTPRPPHG
jgi:hypothetical protein